MSATTTSTTTSSGEALKIDLGCGQRPREGFKGADLFPGADFPMDLLVFPWPWADNSVDELSSSHFVEHIPMTGTPDLLIQFMNEAHRVLKPGGIFEIRHPYGQNARAFQDPTHRRFIVEMTWYYFHQPWLKANGLDHYGITADFDVDVIIGDGIEQSVSLRPQEYQDHCRRFYWNVIADLFVRLKKRAV